MDSKIAAEILDDLIPALESLEAKSEAALQFLKKEGIASDEKLAPFLEQAASASSVRWMAVRVRMERLLSALEKSERDKPAPAERKSEPATEKKTEPVGQKEPDNQPAKAASEREKGTKTADESTPALNETSRPKQKSADNGNKAHREENKESDQQPSNDIEEQKEIRGDRTSDRGKSFEPARNATIEKKVA